MSTSLPASLILDLNTSLVSRLNPSWKAKASHLIESLAKTNKLDASRLVHNTVEDDLPTYHSNYFGYLLTCWDNHLVPVLTPDIVWFTLLHELTSLVRENEDQVRHLFTTSNEKQMIVVTTGTPHILPVNVVVEYLKPLVPSGVDTYLPMFTTTTPQARLAQCAAFCDMISPFYRFGTTLCGFPQIVVQGTIEDWITVAETWFKLPQDLKNLDLTWSSTVQNLLFDIGRAYHQKNADFWRLMFYIKNCGSGHSHDVHGWFRKLYRKQPRSISPECFPASAAKVDYTYLDTNQTFTMLQGLFSSHLEGNVLTPAWNSLVFETTQR